MRTALLLCLLGVVSASSQISVDVKCAGFTFYLMNGVTNAPIHLTRGDTVTFVLDKTCNSTRHPFEIIDSENVTYTHGTTNNIPNGTTTGSVVLVTDVNTTAQIYYRCSLHPLMRGRIIISEPRIIAVNCSVCPSNYFLNGIEPATFGAVRAYVGETIVFTIDPNCEASPLWIFHDVMGVKTAYNASTTNNSEVGVGSGDLTLVVTESTPLDLRLDTIRTSYLLDIVINRATSSPSTGRPSRQPTSQPSIQPTSQPSIQPTSQPSIQPTSQPTSKPSSSMPTHAPSVSVTPTTAPTNLANTTVNSALSTSHCSAILVAFSYLVLLI